MRILGEWWPGHDGVVRPVVEMLAQGADGQIHTQRFLVDTGADRTVLSAALRLLLSLPEEDPPTGFGLAGVGGTSPITAVATALEFAHSDSSVVLRGQFASFLDPEAADLSILGRDVLKNFDVILSERRNEVLLLAGNHRYAVERL